MAGQELTIFGLKAVFTLAAVVLIAVYLVRPIWKALGHRPDFLDSMNQFDINADMDEDELEIPTEGEKPGRDIMIENARADPRKAASMVSQWLKDRK